MADQVSSIFHLIGFKIDSKDIATANRQIEKFTTKIAGVGTALSIALTAPILYAGKKIAETLTMFEQWDVSFATMLGDPEKGKQLIDEVLAFAASTPFEIKNITPATKQLLAYGVAQENIIGTLTDLGNVAAGLGVPISRLILNFGQVKTMGKLMGREIRDFQTSGVPILEYVAVVMGKTKQEVTDLASKGKVSFDIMREAFNKMASEGGRFANLMEKQSKTLGGLWSNFMDKITISMRKFESVWLPMLKKGLEILSNGFQFVVDRLTPGIVRLITILGILLGVIGPIMAAFAVIVGTGLIFSKMIAALSVAATASGVTVGFLLAKFILIAAAIAAVTVAVAALIEDLWMFASGQESLVGEFLGPWSELKPKIMAYFDDLWQFLKAYVIVFREIFVGFAKIIKGFIDSDVDKSVEGIKQIVIGLWDYVKSIIFNLIPFLLKVLDQVSYMAALLLVELFKKTGVFLTEIEKKVWSWLTGGVFDRVKNYISSKIGSISSLIFGKDPELAISGSGFAAASMPGSVMAAGGNSRSVNINVDSKVTTQVPEGTTEVQKKYLNTINREVIAEELGKQFSNISSNITEDD